jgi:hypothetical protein
MDSNTDLTKYKPTADINRLFGVNEDLPDNELTFAALQNLVRARKTQDALFLVIGRMLKLFKDRKLYTNLDFETFEQFLASEEVSFSREKAYLYIRIYEMFVLKFQMSDEEISKLGVARLMMLVPVLREVVDRDEAITKIEQLGGSNLRYNDFVKNVKDVTNKDGKPTIFWSEEGQKWNVSFFNDTTNLIDMGSWADRQNDK